MQQKTVNSQLIKQNGWKQGACLLIDDSKKVNTTIQNVKIQLEKGLYIVLSQDCDILNNSLEKEPVIELILANKINEYDTEFTADKNPRLLHLTLNDDKVYLEVLPHKRFFISRTYLETLQAEAIRVSGQPLKVLISWIAKRYKRPAFPHAFNIRIKPIIKKVKQILSNEAKNTLGLFIQLSPERELMPDKAYKVIIKLLVPKDIYENEKELLKIENGFDQILISLNKVNGIEVIAGSQVQSMDDITMHEYQQLKQWDFDYISFLNDESGETVNNIII